ncbi:uncharacterized protein [Drosophila virilis]|uniref:Uncharacterized protein, isoform A n=1 Tax=Drosophila virilis TaxID=7244 RepID=B4M9W9_DROVI|nr:uncharacterized protein LOC6634807 isoform X2 [Drosophila virilis]EDW66028.1 uncharacterized protein Dvir_GJ15806, isoform A [Drosophila virilis]
MKLRSGREINKGPSRDSGNAANDGNAGGSNNAPSSNFAVNSQMIKRRPVRRITHIGPQQMALITERLVNGAPADRFSAAESLAQDRNSNLNSYPNANADMGMAQPLPNEMAPRTRRQARNRANRNPAAGQPMDGVTEIRSESGSHSAKILQPAPAVAAAAAAAAAIVAVPKKKRGARRNQKPKRLPTTRQSMRFIKHFLAQCEKNPTCNRQHLADIVNIVIRWPPLKAPARPDSAENAPEDDHDENLDDLTDPPTPPNTPSDSQDS